MPKTEGWLLVFVFAPICDIDGVKALELPGGKTVSIGQLTFLFTGDKCSAYAEKPRIFFFLSHKVSDADRLNRLHQQDDVKEIVHSCSGFLVCLSEDMDFIKQLPTSLLDTLKQGLSLQQIITRHMQQHLHRRKNLWSTCPTQVMIKDAGEERPPLAPLRWGNADVSVDEIVASDARWIQLTVERGNRAAVDELLAMLIIKRPVAIRYQHLDAASLTNGDGFPRVQANAEPSVLLLEVDEGLDVEARKLAWPIMDNNTVIVIQQSSTRPNPAETNHQITHDGLTDSDQESRKATGAICESYVQTYLRVSYQSKKDLKPTMDILQTKCRNDGQLSEAYDALCEMIQDNHHNEEAEVLLLWQRVTQRKDGLSLKNEEKLKQWSKTIITHFAAQVANQDYKFGESILQLESNLMNYVAENLVEEVFNRSVGRTKTLLRYSASLPLENQHALVERLMERIERSNLMETEHALLLWEHTRSEMKRAANDEKQLLTGIRYILKFDPMLLLNVYKEELDTPMHSIIPDLFNSMSPHDQNVWQKLMKLQHSFVDQCARLTFIQCLLKNVQTTDSNDAFCLYSQAHHVSKEAEMTQEAEGIYCEILKMMPESFKVLLEGGFRFIDDETLEPPLLLDDTERVIRISQGKYRYNQTWRVRVDQERWLVSFVTCCGDKELFICTEIKNDKVQLAAAAHATYWKVKALDSRKLRVSHIERNSSNSDPRSFEWTLKQINEVDDPLKMAAEQVFGGRIELMDKILEKHNFSLGEKGTVESIFQHVCGLSVESAFSFIDHCNAAFHEDLYKLLSDLIEGKEDMSEQEKLLLLIVRLKQNDFDFIEKNLERVMLGGVLKEKMATIVSKSFSGTLNEMLRLIKLSRLLPCLERCILIEILFKGLEQKQLVDSEQALHLWAHAKYTKEETSWATTADDAQKLCSDVIQELKKRDEQLLQLFTSYFDLLANGNVEGLDEGNPHIWIIMVEYISHYYDGDLTKAKQLIGTSRNIPDPLVVALLLLRLYQEMQKNGQENTFEAFRVFNEVKRNMSSTGYLSLPPEQKKHFEKVKKMAPTCVQHILWPQAIHGFFIVNKFSKRSLSVDKWTQTLCLSAEHDEGCNLWLAVVEADTALVSFKHVDTEIILTVANAENWEMKAIDDSSLQINNDELYFSNHNIEKSEQRGSDDDEEESIWTIQPLTREVGKPVQVVSTNKNHTFTLNEEVLKNILTHEIVKNLPVVVVSVAGAYRTGKSFLLNFFIRYLEAKGKGDWLGSGYVPLEGFHWKGGCDADTSGILMWSIPYVVALPTGEKVAVILMDTQGTFDSESTMNDCATIFALSTMVSSVQVYNISKNIQENDLTSLQVFAEYGKLAMADSEIKPFQKLYFLVRDWEYKEQYKFGSTGGKQFLEKRLKIQGNQHSELFSVRQSIISCFEDISCFLMPHPGLDFVERTESDKSTRDIRQEFLSQLRSLVPELLAAENLISKKIGGKPIKAKELFSYFTSYMTHFSTESIPQVQSIYEATVEANSRSAVAECEELYLAGMEEKCQSYQKKVDLVQIHVKLKEQAMDNFLRQPKLGGNKLSEKNVFTLTQQLEKTFSDFSNRNEKLKAEIEKRLRDAVEKATETYRNDTKNMLRKKKVLSEAKLSLGDEKIRRKAVEQFQQSSENVDEEISEQFFAKLREDLQLHFATFALENKRAIESVEENVKIKAKGAEESYRHEMKNLLKDENTLPSPDQFSAEHQSILDAALSKFKLNLDTLCACEDISAKFVGEFEKRFENAYVDLKTELTKARASVDKKNQDSVAAVSEAYCSEMQQLLMPSKPLLDEKSLEAEHVRMKLNAREMLKNKLIAMDEAPNDYLALLDTELGKQYAGFKAQNDFNLAVARAKEHYDSKMKDHRSSCVALRKVHSGVKASAIELFKEQLGARDAAIEPLGQDMDAKLEEFVEKKILSAINGRTKIEAKEFLEAAKRGDLDLLKAFLPLVRSVDVYDYFEYDGTTALMMAAWENHVECVRFLIENGANPNQEDFREDTSLDWAAMGGAAECFHLLFDKVDAENRNLERMMHMTAEKGKAKELRFLIEKGAKLEALDESWNKNTCLHSAAWNKNAECLEFLLRNHSHRFDVNARNGFFKQTALHLAAREGGVAHLQLLMENGADAAARDYKNKTALHYAARSGRAENCQFLLKSIPIDRRDRKGETALMEAAASAKEGAPRVIEFLLENGADPKLQDEKGWNCLHHAARRGYLESVKVLCDRIPLDAKTEVGKTALQLAEERNETEVADLLRAKIAER